MAKGLILVIEDDRATATYICDALELEGYTVRGAVDGAGLEAACKDHPGVILLDINMQGMDGVEVSQRLRADPATAAIPIISMSGGGTKPPPDMLSNEHLPKPFGLTELWNAVARQLQQGTS